jgi:hypothetical protein
VTHTDDNAIRLLLRRRGAQALSRRPKAPFMLRSPRALAEQVRGHARCNTQHHLPLSPSTLNAPLRAAGGGAVRR